MTSAITDRLESPWTPAVLSALVLLISIGVGIYWQTESTGSKREGVSEPGPPVLQIHGTKPPSIDLALSLSYTATTEKRKCQKFTARTMDYVPIKPDWHVWPDKPPSEKSGRRDRVVPMDTTGPRPDSLKGRDLEPFRWNVNAGWMGKPQGCDFEVVWIGFLNIYDGKVNLSNTFFRSFKEVGSFNIKANERRCTNKEIHKGGRGELEVVCRWGGFGFDEEPINQLECEMRETKSLAYCLERPIPDTIDVSLDIRYLNEAPSE